MPAHHAVLFKCADGIVFLPCGCWTNVHVHCQPFGHFEGRGPAILRHHWWPPLGDISPLVRGLFSILQLSPWPVKVICTVNMKTIRQIVSFWVGSAPFNQHQHPLWLSDRVHLEAGQLYYWARTNHDGWIAAASACNLSVAQLQAACLPFHHTWRKKSSPTIWQLGQIWHILVPISD